MKAGLVAMAFAARALHESNVRLSGDLILQAVVGEESLEHELGTTAVLDRGFSADAAIVGEPTGWAAPLSVMPSEPGLLGLGIVVGGKTAHASMRGEVVHGSESGRVVAASAIDKAFLFYEALRQLEVTWASTKTDPLFPAGHFSISPGVMSGGKRHVPSPAYIPDEASLVYAIFYPPGGDAEDVKKEIESCLGQVVASDAWLDAHPPQLVWPIGVPAGSLAPDHPLATTLVKARELACEGTPYSGPTPVQGFPAVCDMTWLLSAGIPTAAFGPGSMRVAHADDEKCSIDEIVASCRAYAVAAMAWCG
jgi:acetylornithine deacetylase